MCPPKTTRKTRSGSRRTLAELLFWPALLLYGEAAVGYFGDVRRPGSAGRAATWGVRLGWLAQTALLVVFLAHHAWLMADAIGRTLFRLLVNRRLLEWITAAQSQSRSTLPALGPSTRDSLLGRRRNSRSSFPWRTRRNWSFPE